MSTYESESLKHLLRRYRLTAGLSQDDLAEKSTVSARTISDLERGQRMSARLETVNLLAKGLGLSIQEHALLLEAARPELHDDAEPALPGDHARPEALRWARSLPVYPTPLIGREKVFAEILLLIESNPERVITLTGPGGAGKTRLAIEAARRTSAFFDDGVAFVSLASVSGSEFVVATIAQTLGIAVASASLLERLEAFLENRHLLLLLDNFEHVVEAAPLIATLRAAAPQVSVMVTSRVRLRLSAEIEYPVPALDLPAPGESIDQLQANEALRLFVDRAHAIDPHFALTDQNTGTVSEICRRLGGLPLAIELVASRLKVLPVSALLSRLQHQLPLLAGGSRDMPHRQQSMRNSIAWSYDLLDPSERRLLRWMSVFVGGFSLEAAEATGKAIGLEPVQTFELVLSLVDNALMQNVSGSGANPRFRMLETIREFGLEQLAESVELDDARMFHATHFLAFAEVDAPSPTGNIEDSWLRQLDREHDNLVPAFDLLCQPGTGDLCAQFAAALGPYWYVRGPTQEGWSRLSRAVVLAPPEPTPLLRRVLHWAAHVAMEAGEFTEATALAHEGIAVANVAGDLADRAAAIHCLAWLEEIQEHWDAAAELFDQEIALWREMSNPFMEGAVLMLSGGIAYAQGNLGLARQREMTAAALLSEFGDLTWVASTDWYLGFIAVAEGNLAEAAAHYQRSLHHWLQIAEAFRHFKSLVGLADIAASIGQCESAARLLGGCDKLLEAAGARLYPFDVPGYQRAAQCSQATLGETAFESAYLAGRYLSPADWLAEAATIVDAAEESTRGLC